MPNPNTLDCQSFSDRIQDLMDQRIPLAMDDQLIDHADYCQQCQAELEQFSQLETMLLVAFAESSNGATEFAVQSSKKHFNRNHWQMAVAVLAMAASFLFILPSFMGGELKNSDGFKMASVEQGKQKSDAETDQIVSNSPEYRIRNVVLELPRPLQNAYQYAAELPGVRPLECSVDLTIEMIQESLKPFSENFRPAENPDLGIQSRIALNRVV